MSNLSVELVVELTRRVEARLKTEWPREHVISPQPGIVRVVIEVYERWRDERAQEDAADDIADLAAFWPNIPDLQGEDMFAAEHGEPTGQMEPTAQEMGEDYGLDDDDPAPEPSLSFVHVAPPRPIGRDRALDAAIAPEPEYHIVRPSLARYIKPGLTTKQRQTAAEQEDELHEIVATIQTIAVDGQMPSITEYRARRPKHLPEWTTITTRYLIATWRQMAQLCGLHYGPATRAPEPETDEDDDEPHYRTKPSGKTRKKETSKPEAEPRNQQPSLRELTDWLRANAMAGVMMSQEQFNTSKPAHWSTATAHVSRLDTSWEQLRQEAGLKPNPRWGATRQADAAA